MNTSKNRGWILAILIAAAMIFTACNDDTSSSNTGQNSDVTDEPDFSIARPDTSSNNPQDTSNTSCTSSDQRCLNSSTLSACVDGILQEQTCGAAQLCSNGLCQDPLCPTPGQPFACEDDTTRRICEADQSSFRTETCDPGEACTGAGICGPADVGCTESTFDCLNSVPRECISGQWIPQGECGPKENCIPGAGCQSLCEANNKQSSFLGCEYYILDMDNDGSPSTWSTCTSSASCAPGDSCEGSCFDFLGDPTGEQCSGGSGCSGLFSSCEMFCTQPSHDDQSFGVTISNPNFDYAAIVSIAGGGTIETVEVPPGELRVVELVSNTDAETGGLFTNKVFFATSDAPITMHQFNPLNGSGVFSNDASLLLPTNALANAASGGPVEYIVLNQNSGQPYVDIIAIENNTVITITSPIGISNASPFGAISAGVPKTFTMGSNNLMHLIANNYDDDITGMVIEASKPIAVFSGAQCAQVPHGTNYCDHIEQQLFPVHSWGNTYIAAKSRSRGAEPDVWKIVASQDNTTVTLSGGVTKTLTLNKGQSHEEITTAHFSVSATAPVLLGQFLVGSNYGDGAIPATCGLPCRSTSDCDNAVGVGSCIAGECVWPCSAGCETYGAICDNANNKCVWSGIGDPAYTLAVPTLQYRTSYTVLTPEGYKENYLTLITPTGSVPQINAVPATDAPYNAAPQPGVTGWDIYHIAVPEGVQQIQNSSPFGVIAYGYDCDVSYAYPGGLNLETIN